MPRISLWKGGKHTNDFEFFDKIINEQFTVGGTDMHIYKYLGPAPQEDTGDATQPGISQPDELDIQDILFLENRDRTYDPDIYNLRGMYKMNDTDFDLSQFGLFLATDTIFITFHLKTMFDMIGRKVMAGDVLELPHMIDYYPLDNDIPNALRKYYMVEDASRPAEGYSPTWWPHLWRVKVTPLVNSQEVSDLFDKIGPGGEPLDDALADPPVQSPTFGDKLEEITDGIVEEAENQVPSSGYDTSEFYVVPIDEDGEAREPHNLRASMTILPATSTPITADNTSLNADAIGTSPEENIAGGAVPGTYILGDGLAPNGYPMLEATEFPLDAIVGDYVLRTDSLPNRLFRYDGKHWIKMEDDQRSPQSSLERETQLATFQNNENVSEGGHRDNCFGSTEERQALSQILRPKADN